MTFEQKVRKAAYMKAWREKNREHVDAARAIWYAKNRESVIARSRVNYIKNRERNLAQAKVWAAEEHPEFPGWTKGQVRTLKLSHGLNPRAWQQMWDAQSGRCACCNEPMTKQKVLGACKTDACVDHCHDLNYIRALLCSLCNRKVGWLEKMPAHIRQYMGRILTELQARRVET